MLWNDGPRDAYELIRLLKKKFWQAIEPLSNAVNYGESRGPRDAHEMFYFLKKKFKHANKPLSAGRMPDEMHKSLFHTLKDFLGYVQEESGLPTWALIAIPTLLVGAALCCLLRSVGEFITGPSDEEDLYICDHPIEQEDDEEEYSWYDEEENEDYEEEDMEYDEEDIEENEEEQEQEQVEDSQKTGAKAQNKEDENKTVKIESAIQHADGEVPEITDKPSTDQVRKPD